MTKLRLFFSIVGLAAFAFLVWFFGPLVAVGGRVPLDSEGRRLALILVVVIAWALVGAWRALSARRADRQLADGLGGAAAAPAAGGNDTMVRSLDETELLRARFRSALVSLRRAGRGRAARLSRLPWYVLIGPPGAGKTTALQNAGLHLPLAERDGLEPLRGVGGTRHCDWWFSDDAVLIDTAGRYTTQDSDAAVDGTGWNAFLALLRRHRRPRPLNGVIVAISIADVLSIDIEQRAQHARALKQRIGELDDTLGLRLPVYVMLTKSDGVPGFAAFFERLERAEREQVWGVTFAADEADALARFDGAFDALVSRLNDRLLTRLDDERDAVRRALLFGFPREVAALKDDIASFLSDVFRGSRHDAAFWLRGVYLTSAVSTLATGRPGLAPAPHAAEPGAGARRSHFLAGLLQRVVFAEAELVGSDRRAERRRRWLHAIACGLGALGVAAGVGAWTMAFGHNQERIARLHERVRSVADAEAGEPVVAASWPALLARLDALRGLAIDEGERGAAPPDFGLHQARALESAARHAYLREMNRQFAPRIAALLAKMLRDADRAADPTYAALKGYLMLDQPEHRDAAYLKALLQLQWERELPRQPEAVARLQAHLDALLVGGLEPPALDGDLIAAARATLNRVPLAELAYSRLKREALAHDDHPFVPRQVLGAVGAAAFERPSGLSLDVGIPGLFTAQGIAEVYTPQSLRLAQSLRGDIWVLGSGRGDSVGTAPAAGADELATLGDDVGRLYAAEYVRTWNALLGDLRIARFHSAAQGLDALAGLSGRDSALRTLLVAVDRNTRLLPGGAPGVEARVAGRITDGFQRAKDELSQLLATPTAGGRAAAATDPRPGAQIAAAFADLDALVQADKDGHAPVDAVIDRLAALYAEINAAPPPDAAAPDRRADSPASRNLTQLALAQPQPLRVWLQQLASGGAQLGDEQQAAALKTKHADDAKALRDKLNAAWKSDVLPFCTTAVAHRYPIDRHASADATLKDFARLFGPGGLIDAFVKDNLRPFIDTSSRPWRWRAADQVDLGAAPDALRPLEIAAATRDAFFRDGAGPPAVEFTLRAVPTDDAAQRVGLTQGDQPWVDAAAPTRSVPVRWPAADASQPLTLSVSDARGAADSRSADGPWAWFRLLDQASVERSTPDRLVATFHLPTHVAQLELRASSVVNPFQPIALDQFQCPKGF